MTPRGLLVALAGLVLLGAGAVIAAGEYLSSPARRVVGAPPPSLNAVAVSIPTAKGNVAGWYARRLPGTASILLLHGVRGDRRQMLERARFLARDGYGVLLIDLQAHGESDGERIAFGAREALGVTAALDFLAHERPGQKIGVIGVSLGAASLVLSRPGKAIDALVIEAMYPTIEEAVANRMMRVFGRAGGSLAPLLLKQLPMRLNLPLETLRTIDAVADITCPTLVIGGSSDTYTSPNETRRIYAAIHAQKALWIVDGAAHVDFRTFAQASYEKRVGEFLAKQLQTPSRQ